MRAELNLTPDFSFVIRKQKIAQLSFRFAYENQRKYDEQSR